MASILTNTAANAALQTLRTIGNNLTDTQNRVSSGLRVGSAADNAAYWSIATTLRSDAGALSAVQDALGIGAAKVDTAYTGLEASIEVVKEIKNKLVLAQDPTADRAKIQKEITQLQEQLVSISDSSTYNGENWLKATISDAAGADVTGAALTALNKQVVGSFTRDASGNVKVQKIDVVLNTDNVLFDAGGAIAAGTTAATKRGILDVEAEGLTAGTKVANTSVSTLDISNLNAYKVDATGLAAADGSDNDVLDKLISHVDAQLEALNFAASDIGSVSKRIGLQEDFVAKLSDTIETSIGRLVDADLNEESTRLKALQTQQQLAIQSLSIANSNSENILSLFR